MLRVTSNDSMLSRRLLPSQSFHNTEEKNNLSTLNGCYVPCLLNIMGVILFLRLGWAIGEAGVGYVLLMFVVAETMTLLTVLSLSAMLTNGAMKGGGSYFMISRTLGPEFGGSIGLLFWVAYAVGASFYIIGFAEEVRNTWFSSQDTNVWFTAGIGSLGLFGTLLISLAGARYFTKINVLLFLVQFSAIIMALLAMFIRQDVKLASGTFSAWSFDNLHSHWAASFTNNKELCSGKCDFVIVFGVLFPAVTGIMEGANLSGDLKDPDYSIPRGTLGAVFTSIFFYMLLLLGYAGCVSRDGLQNNLTVMQDIAWSDNYVVTGILVSTVSSCLGAIFGGSRVLQALARDGIFPGTKWLRYGTKRGDEPLFAVMATWAVAQGCTLIGNLNAIAPIISSFFCLSYATVNLACFLLEVSGTPNFRPHWNWYNKYTAAAGFLMAMAINFWLDYKFAACSLAIQILVFFYLVKKGPKVAWGDVTQSLLFHQIRKFLLQMDQNKSHNKHWRPSVMLVQFDLDLALIDFCNILKKGGLYVIGNIIVTENFQETAIEALKHKKAWLKFITEAKIKAFSQTAVAPSIRLGCQNLLMMGGIGALMPNTIVLPLLFDEEGRDKQMSSNLKYNLRNFVGKKSSMGITHLSQDFLASAEIDIGDLSMKHKESKNLDVLEYLGIINDVLISKKNVIVAENFETYNLKLLNSVSIQQYVRRATGACSEQELLSPGSTIKEKLLQTTLEKKKRIDVWIDFSAYSWDMANSKRDSGFPALMLQLAFVVSQNPQFARGSKIRAILLVELNRDEKAKEVFLSCCKVLRLKVDFIECVQDVEGTLKWDEMQNEEKYDFGGAVKADREAVYRDDINLAVTKAVTLARRLNNLLCEHSEDTYITFFALPEIPSMIHNAPDLSRRLGHIWLLHLVNLVRGIPCPIAFVKTGEIDPVISTAM